MFEFCKHLFEVHNRRMPLMAHLCCIKRSQNENKMENKRIALVTGGSRGLGRDMAINLAKKGLNVVLTYNSRNDEALKVIAEIEATGGKAAAVQLNTSSTTNFAAFAEQLKETLKTTFGTDRIDALVNNAGTALYAPITDVTEEQFDDMMNIHLKGVFFLTQKMLPMMNDGGSIVNISSGLARFALPGSSVYAAMKGGVEVLTRYMAKELGARQINVNTVAPGAVETDFGGGRVRDNADINKMVASMTALGRVGLPTDIGAVVAFLCTPEAKWINAQRIEVSGGTLI
jgi:NAD(P)-dependent dehydrogenase (short-subunit alcohol dehydrogenase family)